MIAGAVLLARLRRYRNSVHPRGRAAKKRFGAVVFGFLLALVLAMLVTASLVALFVTLTDEGAGARDAATALALILSATLVGLLVFDLHETVTTLVVDSDLDLLRRAPLSTGTLFTIKLLDALPRTSLLLLVLALPAVFSFHAFFPLPAWAWAVLPLQLLALWAIPLGLGIAIALQALRTVPARHARDALGLVSTLVLFGLWLANSFLLPRLAASASDPSGSIRDMLHAVPAFYALSPGTWLAAGVAAAAEGRVPEAVRWTALLLATAAGSLGIAAVSAAAHLETVQLRLVTGSGSGRGRTLPALRGEDASRPQSFVGAVLRRDAALLARNWTVLGDLVTAAALWTLLPLVGKPLFQFTSLSIARAMLLALTVALGYEIAARAIPLERRGATWMRLAPIPSSHWIAARYLGTSVLAAGLLAFATTSIALALRLGAGDLVGILIIVVPALALALAIGLWTGATFGDPGWTNPRAMLTLTGRAVATLLLLGQAGAWLGFSALLDARPGSLVAVVAPWVPIAAALVLVPLALRAAAQRIDRVS